MKTTSFYAILRISFLAAATGLAACTQPDLPVSQANGIYDPYESTNRGIHKFNLSLDRAILRPASKGYSSILPDEIEDSIGNFAENLSMPGVAVNALLQGDLRTAGLATTRLLINTGLGIGGFIDVATEFNIDEANTDFGETLHVWGAGEGAYIELPLLGPSTERDVVGKVVDLFTNPLSYTMPEPERYYGTAASVASRLSDRGRFSDTVDSILYESADSYAQSRLIYLQSRRFELGQEDAGSQIDPFALDTEGF
jgi:phospholipid-binding lipoprotein MlaA